MTRPASITIPGGISPTSLAWFSEPSATILNREYFSDFTDYSVACQVKVWTGAAFEYKPSKFWDGTVWRCAKIKGYGTPVVPFDVGTPTVGADTFPPSDGRVMLSGPYTVPSNGTLQDIRVYESGGSAGGNLYGLVFADDGANMPTGAPIAMGDAVATTGTAGWLHSVLAVPVAVTAGQKIHVGYVTSGVYATAFVHQTGSGTMLRYEAWPGSGALPALGGSYGSLLSAYAHGTT